jgi:hypothetical protein
MDVLSDDDDEFTSLFDADLPRADLVGSPANGVDEWLVMKGAEDAGLFDAEFVRDLISKSDPDTAREVTMPTTLPNGITLTGSPADIAAFIHKASERQAPEVVEAAKAAAEYEQVIKAKYNAEDRKKMSASGAAMKDGSYPIADAADLTSAIRAVGRGGADHDAIRKHVITRAKSLGKSSEIPDNWNSDGSLKAGVSKEAGVPEAAVAKDAGDAMDAAMDDGTDGLDPTVPAGSPGDLDGIPGDPADPGSAAWEAVDAATAVKWSTILAGAKRAVCWLMDRESVEAATVDPDDAGNACDLSTVCDALDYAIGELAPYAVMEQSESDRLAFEASVAKSAATDPASVTAAVVAIAKAGRVLSGANEAKIRQASQHLNDVLASLPQAPTEGGPAAVTKEEGAMPGTTSADVAKDTAPSAEQQAAGTGPVNAGGTTGLGEPRTTGPADALPADGPQDTLPGDVPGRTVVKSALALVFDRDGGFAGVCDSGAIVTQVAKADGEKAPMQAVFDADGNLIGIVNPTAIQPVTGAGAGGKKDAKPADPAASAGDGTDAPADAAAAPADGASAGEDLTPQPSADAGTPASGAAPADDEDPAVAKAAADEDVITVNADALQSAIAKAVAAALVAAAPAEGVAKSADVAGAIAEVELLKARLAKVEETPAAPKVFTNGQVPPAHQLRGQDQGGAQQVDVAKARARKAELYSADGPGQARLAKEMQYDAVAVLRSLQSGR